MKRSKRLAFASTVLMALVAAVVAPAPQAAADTPGATIDNGNVASDPHVIKCTNWNGVAGYCLYTSRDMGQQYAYPPANHYPMRETFLYFSRNGYSGWETMGSVIAESQLDAWAGRRNCAAGSNAAPDPVGNCRAYHLWAPSAVKLSETEYWVYVPDVTSTANSGPSNTHNSSRVAVMRGGNGAFGGYSYWGFVTGGTQYMSDPDIVVEGNDRHLLWADGDYDTCGGLWYGKLNPNMTTITPGTATEIVISGVNVLGNCGNKGRPYLEGPSLYHKNYSPIHGWTIFFAAKPDHVPTECTEANTGQGVANTDNEVIAWASASNPQGPYTYQGIVMCGSTTEWTNQATITTTSTGREVILYHDSAAGVKMRHIHGDCLYTGVGIIAGVYRQSITDPNALNSCASGLNQDFQGLYATDPQAPGLPTIMSATGGGSGDVVASRYQVGPWERFRIAPVTGTTGYAIQSLANSRYLCAGNASTALTPSCTRPTGVALFDKINEAPYDRFRLKSRVTGNYVSLSPNGRLYSDTATAGSAAVFVQLGS